MDGFVDIRMTILQDLDPTTGENFSRWGGWRHAGAFDRGQRTDGHFPFQDPGGCRLVCTCTQEQGQYKKYSNYGFRFHSLALIKVTILELYFLQRKTGLFHSLANVNLTLIYFLLSICILKIDPNQDLGREENMKDLVNKLVNEAGLSSETAQKVIHIVVDYIEADLPLSRKTEIDLQLQEISQKDLGKDRQPYTIP